MTLVTLKDAECLILNAGTYILHGETKPSLSLGEWFDSLAELIDSYAVDYGMANDELIDWLNDCDGTCVVYDAESEQFTLLL